MIAFKKHPNQLQYKSLPPAHSHFSNIFTTDWLHKQGVEFQSLEDMSRSEIASALEQFYLTARRPNGTQYKKNTLKSIKHSLDHYLRASPMKKDFSISTDYDFRQVHKTSSHCHS